VEVLASLVFISGLSNKITFNKELWISSFPLAKQDALKTRPDLL
jgi:hypothetical protein